MFSCNGDVFVKFNIRRIAKCMLEAMLFYNIIIMAFDDQ